MPEFQIIKEQIERRTYVKGWFRGKFVGYLDSKNSDNTHENFYNLEILSGEMSAKKTNFRTWKEGDEFAEFFNVDKFITKLPNPLHCAVTYENGDIKHFKINLQESKLKHHTLSQRLYDGNKVFATIEGEISGYLKHYETIEKEIEIPSSLNNTIETIENSTKDLSNSNFNERNKIDGCAVLFATGFAYVFLIVSLLTVLFGIIAFFINASLGLVILLLIIGLVFGTIVKSREILVSVVSLFFLFLFIKLFIAVLFEWRFFLLISIFGLSLFLTFPKSRSFYTVSKWLISLIIFILVFAFSIQIGGF
jgi:hypothetical protein